MKNFKKNVRKRLAIFDIDGTIFRSSLLVELTEALIRAEIFPKKVRQKYLLANQRWLNRQGLYENYIKAVVEVFFQNIKGVQEKDFIKIAKKTILLHQDRVYRYTRDLVKSLKKKKFYLLAISNSPKMIVDEFAKKMGFDKTYGQMYEINKNGKFTGKIISSELIADKAKILKRVLAKEEITLKGSIGVGDTESDIAFLKIVEKPICFNPNKKLYQTAKHHGWQIIVERKNVIYYL